MLTDLLAVNLEKELGLDRLPEDQRKQLVDQMSAVVENRLNRRLLALLSDDDKKELDKVLDSDGDVVDFLSKKIPNINLEVAEVIAEFKREMLDLQNAVDKATASNN